MASDPDADKRAKKKLLLVLLAWDEQYKDDPNMYFVAGVLKHYGSGLSRRSGRSSQSGGATTDETTSNGEEEKKKEKKNKVDVLAELSKSEKASTKVKKEKKKKQEPQNKRVPFDFEKVYPVLSFLERSGSEIRTCRTKRRSCRA